MTTTTPDPPDECTAVKVPAAFAAGILAQEGEAGRAWLGRLPGLVVRLCRDWRLSIDGEPRHGHLGLVVPVRRADELLALKVSLIEPTTVHERLALAAWAGHGAVRLLDARPDDGALLLERLDAARTLASLPLAVAVPIAAGIYRRLAIPAPAGFPRQREVATAIADGMVDRWVRSGRPFPEHMLCRSVELARALASPAQERLVNFDLHDDNILAGERAPWLVIDPKVIAGDPEYGVAQFFWCRADETHGRADFHRHLDVFIARADLDPERTHAWMIVRLVDYWLWALSIGLTEDPRRCRKLIAWLTDRTTA